MKKMQWRWIAESWHLPTYLCFKGNSCQNQALTKWKLMISRSAIGNSDFKATVASKAFACLQTSSGAYSDLDRLTIFAVFAFFLEEHYSPSSTHWRHHISKFSFLFMESYMTEFNGKDVKWDFWPYYHHRGEGNRLDHGEAEGERSHLNFWSVAKRALGRSVTRSSRLHVNYGEEAEIMLFSSSAIGMSLWRRGAAFSVWGVPSHYLYHPISFGPSTRQYILKPRINHDTIRSDRLFWRTQLKVQDQWYVFSHKGMAGNDSAAVLLHEWYSSLFPQRSACPQGNPNAARSR